MVRNKIAAADTRVGNLKNDSAAGSCVVGSGGGASSAAGGKGISRGVLARGEGEEGGTNRIKPIVQGTRAGGREYILTEEQYETLMMRMSNRPRSLSSEVTSFVASSSVVGLSSPSPPLSGRSRLSSLTAPTDSSYRSAGTGLGNYNAFIVIDCWR